MGRVNTLPKNFLLEILCHSRSHFAKNQKSLFFGLCITEFNRGYLQNDKKTIFMQFILNAFCHILQAFFELFPEPKLPETFSSAADENTQRHLG